MQAEEVLQELRALGHASFLEGMARFGIATDNALGIKLPVLRSYAKQYKKNHGLALDLWETGVHEARLLAIFIADPHQVDEKLMENWVKDFDSWDICDQACSSLFDKTPWAYEKAVEWAVRVREFEKRAAFALMAALVVHDKKASDEKFVRFLPVIEREAQDDRNFVKKAVNWALRQIGKRNGTLNAMALESAERILRQPGRAARWVASDAIRELGRAKEKFQEKR